MNPLVGSYLPASPRDSMPHCTPLAYQQLLGLQQQLGLGLGRQAGDQGVPGLVAKVGADPE